MYLFRESGSPNNRKNETVKLQKSVTLLKLGNLVFTYSTLILLLKMI